MIVVFGATGTIGGEVLRHLAADGAPVRAVVRSPGRAEALHGATADVAVADLDDPASLDPVLRDADRVFLATPASEDQVRLEGNLVDALTHAGTEAHPVKLAALGYDAAPPEEAIALSANHARIVQHVRDRGVAHTVLTPSGFASNLLGSADPVRQQGVLHGSAGDGGLSWVDPRDIDAVAAHVLTTPCHEGASYAVTGPEVLTFAQVAGRMGAVLRREVCYVDVPAEQLRVSLRSAGLPEWIVGALTELQQLYRAHLAEVVTDEVAKATGRPPRSLDEWLADHRAAFTG